MFYRACEQLGGQLLSKLSWIKVFTHASASLQLVAQGSLKFTRTPCRIPTVHLALPITRSQASCTLQTRRALSLFMQVHALHGLGIVARQAFVTSVLPTVVKQQNP